MSEHFDSKSAARVALLNILRARGYHFVTPTPATHARIIARADTQIARNLRDVFGWSLPFEPGLLDADMINALQQADALEARGDLLASGVRVSSLDDDLLLHSAYPTIAPDSVFFGPDSYRFAAFLRSELPRLAPRRDLVDIGAGAGVGAFTAMKCGLQLEAITLTDINRRALDFARANKFALQTTPWCGVMDFVLGSGVDEVSADNIDCIIGNPPYIADPLHRAYRDGGAMHGAALSLEWARQAAERLDRGGAFLLYTGSAIVNGEDCFKAALLETLRDFDVRYRELDPDVFGEELEGADYADVERIAVVGCVAVKR